MYLQNHLDMDNKLLLNEHLFRDHLFGEGYNTNMHVSRFLRVSTAKVTSYIYQHLI